MAKVTISLDSGEDGRLNTDAILLRVQGAMQALKPESAYFVEEEGEWECLFVFTLNVGTLIQPLFPGLDASFDVRPVMNAAEFQALGDPRGGDEAAVEKADPELVTDLSPESAHPERVAERDASLRPGFWVRYGANKPPERPRPSDPEWPYVPTQRERDKQAKKFLKGK